jgi:hypothetical protein
LGWFWPPPVVGEMAIFQQLLVLAFAEQDRDCQNHGLALHSGPMPRIALSFSIAVLLTCCFGMADANPKRRIACKTAANSASCYWTRGRLNYYNGTPAFRLWKIGTHRLLGIYSGPSVDRYGLDNESPEFPANVDIDPFHLFDHRIYAGFEVCPLEQERPGAMQAACIESAKNIFVEKLEK